VSPPRPGVKYTAEQMQQMQREYPHFAMPGYVIRLEAGLFSFVRWDDASYGGQGGPRSPRAYELVPTEPLVAPPIRKRTPQQRLESLANNWDPDIRKAGTVPGLTEAQLEDVVGRAWRRGEPVTRTKVEEFAAEMLKRAENRFEAAERKRTVRTAPSD